MQPVPRTVEAIREVLSRDRRWSERRAGKRDNRIFPSDRRAADRRSVGRDGLPWHPEEQGYVDATDLIIEMVDDPAARSDTRIASEEERPDARAVAELTGPRREPCANDGHAATCCNPGSDHHACGGDR